MTRIAILATGLALALAACTAAEPTEPYGMNIGEADFIGTGYDIFDPDVGIGDGVAEQEYGFDGGLAGDEPDLDGIGLDR